MLKILQHDNIWGDNPPLQILGDLSLPRPPPVIYAHVKRPKTYLRTSSTGEAGIIVFSDVCLSVSVCLSVCLSVRAQLKTNCSEIGATRYEYVLW